ncbi:hypothetical protein CSTERLE_01100 [Thermoclostridium stercorarium subsp. leptospartum DSM 9219]|uniref:Lipoprotein LipO n=1 Tax=Thermoclostridium stercorarium subsp. leptospartum DSM 9219 TaxID=1346611 RepID=A0A1B1YHP4_THEST|nr:extracellular solute-binding protein [Thermoclostridium stercorarium]ANX00285.1 hypothetical protein CSTERLE_01100 [Thermoclostridium stercorarium subsp. leptospartum DSM 9219]
MRRKISILCLVLAVIFALSACSGSKTSNSNTTPTQGAQQGDTSQPTKPAEKKKEIGILAITFTGTPIADNEPAVLALEELTGYDIKLEFLLNSAYEDQLNTRMAAGNLPALVVITGKTASVINYCRAGAFWDITDEYKKYPNLAKANEIVMNNISIDGRIYGIYRARPLGRNGISYRKDWLENLGLEEPKTMDDLYNVLKAFTYNDPDGNNVNDTYGMTWCKYYGPLDQISVALGAPNKWKVEDDGTFVPDFDTPEYMEAMKYMRKLYEEGLINRDYAALETSDWTKDFQNGKSGVHIDVSDQAWRFQKKFIEMGMDDDIVWVMGMPEGPFGKRILPTSGHVGFVAISKAGAPTEEDMRDALNFLDLCNTKEAQNILYFGVEGIHYDLTEEGYVKRRQFDQDPMEGFNQFMTNVVDGLLLMEEMTPVQKRREEVILENIPYCVANPAEPLTSNTYANKGAQLDQMITDARNQFIAGQLDEAGFKAVVQEWYAQGGKQICEEYAEAYRAAHGN